MATKRTANKDAEERRLESLVLGLDSRPPAERSDSPDSGGELTEAEADGLLRLDRRGAAADGDDGAPAPRRPAWTDEDDELVTVSQAAATFAGVQSVSPAEGGQYGAALQRRFAAVVGATPDWAKLDRKRRRRASDSSDNEAQDAAELVTRTGRLIAGDGGTAGGRLAKGSLLFKRCGDLAGATAPRPRIVTALELHRSSQVALVGGGGRSALALVQVDGRDNPLVQAVPLPAGFAVNCAHFTADGRQVVASSRRASYLVCYDMMSGRMVRADAGRRLDMRAVPRLTMSPDGRWLAVPSTRAGAVHLLTAAGREWVHTLQPGGRVTALAFSADGSWLYTHTHDGDVYVWNMASRQCEHRFTDEGCLGGSAVAASPDGRLLACGSSSGVVNVYETATARQQRYPSPVKVLNQLTTECDRLLFNATGEVLAMASAQKEHALKLVHVPSMTVFSNFPGWTQTVYEPHAVDFSPNGGFLAVGNNKSRALLYRLQHYGSY